MRLQTSWTCKTLPTYLADVSLLARVSVQMARTLIRTPERLFTYMAFEGLFAIVFTYVALQNLIPGEALMADMTLEGAILLCRSR